MKRKRGSRLLSFLLVGLVMLTGCGSSNIDDLATNEGYETVQKQGGSNQGSEDAESGNTNTAGIKKENFGCRNIASFSVGGW